MSSYIRKGKEEGCPESPSGEPQEACPNTQHSDEVAARLLATVDDLLSLRNDLAWFAQIDRPGSATRLALGRDIAAVLEERAELARCLKNMVHALDAAQGPLADVLAPKINATRNAAIDAIAKATGAAPLSAPQGAQGEARSPGPNKTSPLKDLNREKRT